MIAIAKNVNRERPPMAESPTPDRTLYLYRVLQYAVASTPAVADVMGTLLDIAAAAKADGDQDASLAILECVAVISAARPKPASAVNDWLHELAAGVESTPDANLVDDHCPICDEHESDCTCLGEARP